MPRTATLEPSASTTPANDTTLYFAIAIGLCWAALTPASLAALGVLPGPPDDYMAGAPLAVLAPTIAAIVAARREGGWPGVRALLRGLGAFRVSPIWFVLALTIPGLVMTIGRAAYGLFADDGGAWMYLPTRPEHVAGLLVVPIAEEIGWRGYALPRLIARHGAHRATAYLGVLWALWHVPMFLAVGNSWALVLESMLFIVLGSVLFTWFYRRTGGSLLLAVLLHVGAHLDSPSHGPPGFDLPMHYTTVAYVVVAIALLALDRRAWEGRTPQAPGVTPA